MGKTHLVDPLLPKFAQTIFPEHLPDAGKTNFLFKIVGVNQGIQNFEAKLTLICEQLVTRDEFSRRISNVSLKIFQT
jgi:hypothetical protein